MPIHPQLWRTSSWRMTVALATLLFLAACSGSPAATPSTENSADAAPTATAATNTVAEADAVTDTDTTTSTAAGSATNAVTTTEAVTGAMTETGATTATSDTTAGASTTAPVVATDFDPAQVSLALQTLYSGFDQPLFVTHAGDDSNRLFVVEKTGRIRIVREGQTLETPFLDLSTQVKSNGSEQGLLGLAFPPNFSESGHFFVNYTDAAGDTVISRFQVSTDNADVATRDSEFFVLRFDQPAPNHNGGMLLFGPDGYLWIGTGDGGAANDIFGNGQNPQTVLGKMLRLDVTSDPTLPYTIPADNPWVSNDWNGSDVLDEIWAIGLRNPWRYSFDRATDDLWIADVGQNQFEEVNFTPASSSGGLNYGWPIMEAQHCFQQGDCDSSGLEMPIAEYDHAGGHCSVTGGYVYRGSTFPALQGVYIFGDYCSGTIWATTPDGQGGWVTNQLLDTDAILSSFGEDEAGELYATDLSAGVVYQVVVE